MKNKKIWITGLVITALAIAGIFAFGIQPNVNAATDASQVTLVEVQSGTLEATVGATGKVRAVQSAKLTWSTSGIVNSVNVTIGQDVAEGEVLADLAQTSLPQNIILAEADLVAAEKALEDLLDTDAARARALLTLAQAQEALEDAEYEWYVQQEGNRASGETIAATEANLILAQKEVDQAQTAYSKYSGRPEDDPARALARSNLATARQKRDTILRNLNWYLGYPSETDQALLDAELELARSNVREAEKVLAEIEDGPDPDDVAAAEARIAAAEKNLKAAWIEAPFEGTVTDVEALPRDKVNQNQTAIVLNNMETLHIDLEISEVDINQIALGQQVLITFDAIPLTQYEGVVVKVSVDGVETNGVVDFPVVVEIINADDQIRLGMTASVEIIVVQQEASLLIPNQAIRVEDGVQVVYQLNDQGTLKAVPVVLGFSSNTSSEVLDSILFEGDEIVLNPSVILNSAGELSIEQLQELNQENGGGPPALFGGGQ